MSRLPVVRCWIVFALLMAGSLMVQAQSASVPTSQTASSAVAEPLAFEVVSIRLKRGFGPGIPEVGPTADGWRMVDNGLAFAILHAYVPQTGGATFYTNEQIVGLPDWSRNESYEIHAKVSEKDLADWQNPAKQPAMLQAMLRAMLKDRCKLAVHRESKEVSVLAVTQGKSGPKLMQSDPDHPHPAGVPLPGGGTIVPEDGGRSIHMYDAPMRSVASLLSNLAKQPVEDRTGLTGRYDLVIPLAILASTAPKLENGEAAEPGPTIFSIVADLGLKLEATKGQVETLVIDHMERPTEN
jgi:uncharacterized protein (TIGR03435 family)